MAYRDKRRKKFFQCNYDFGSLGFNGKINFLRLLYDTIVFFKGLHNTMKLDRNLQCLCIFTFPCHSLISLSLLQKTTSLYTSTKPTYSIFYYTSEHCYESSWALTVIPKVRNMGCITEKLHMPLLFEPIT